MKKIIFIIFCFFFLLTSNVNASYYISQNQKFYFNWNHYYWYNWSWLNENCNTREYVNYVELYKDNENIKTYCWDSFSYLIKDFWNWKYYFVREDNDASKKDFYELLDNFELKKNPSLSITCGNYYILYNWNSSCVDETYKNGHTHQSNLQARWKPVYFKNDYDFKTKSYKYSFDYYDDSWKKINYTTNIGSNYISAPFNVWPNSIALFSLWTDKRKLDIEIFDIFTKNKQIIKTESKTDIISSNELYTDYAWHILYWNSRETHLNTSISESFLKSTSFIDLVSTWKTENVIVNWETLQCKEFTSSELKKCWPWSYLKTQNVWKSTILTCSSWTPKLTLDFNIEWKITFQYYENPVSYPHCWYFTKINNSEPDSIDNSNPKPKDPPNTPKNPKEEKENSWFFKSIVDTLSWLWSKITSWLKTITDWISWAIDKWLKWISDLLWWWVDTSKIDNIKNWVNFENLWNIKTNWEGFLEIKKWTMPSLIKDWQKCKLFNENNLTFLYYSNWNANINFSLKQFKILDNWFWWFLDLITWLFIWPLNNIIAITKTFTPFVNDNQQVCLFWEIKTITFHKFMKDTENYWVMTIFDYIVLFTFSWFIFFLIWWISFFKWIETPWSFNSWKNIKYEKKWYISKENIKKYWLTKEEIKRIT